MPPEAEQLSYGFMKKYLPGVPVSIDYLDDIVACTDQGRSTVWLARSSESVAIRP